MDGETPNDLTPEQRRQRMMLTEFDQRLARMEDCIEQIERNTGTKRRSGTTGRFIRSEGGGYDEGYDQGLTKGYRDGRMSADPRNAGRQHMHPMDGYTGPAMPYENPYQSPYYGPNYETAGYGRRPYVDPYALAYLISTMGNNDPSNYN